MAQSAIVESQGDLVEEVFAKYGEPCNTPSRFTLSTFRASDGVILKDSTFNLTKISEVFGAETGLMYCSKQLPALRGKYELRTYIIKNVSVLLYVNGSSIVVGALSPADALILINYFVARLIKVFGVPLTVTDFTVMTRVHKVDAGVEVQLNEMADTIGPLRCKLVNDGEKSFPLARVIAGPDVYQTEKKRRKNKRKGIKRDEVRYLIPHSGQIIVTGATRLADAKRHVFLAYQLAHFFQVKKRKREEIDIDGVIKSLEFV